MKLPEPRGPLSGLVIDTLRTTPPGVDTALPVDRAALASDDLHLALYLCYELHYTSIEGVDPRWEWDPVLIKIRAHLESAFEEALRDHVVHGEGAASGVIDRVLDAIAQEEGRSLSSFIEHEATIEQVREFVTHRSAYQLKEADPHTWVIPRIRTPTKAALVEIQSDEYGGGRGDRVHSVLFAKAMRALGLDPSYGAYVNRIPGITLATVNLVSMFGLHRRLRGAAIGHLATFETTSSEPNGRYARGLRRLGFDGDATDFFDEHVEADSVHEVIAIHDLVGGFVRDEPGLAADILWGARCLLALERAWADHLLSHWETGASSLLSDEAVPSQP